MIETLVLQESTLLPVTSRRHGRRLRFVKAR